jgi:DNA-binding transcriptional LysR family regulator
MKIDPDKLRIFLAIVDHGGFAAAGRALGRATSVISYGLAGLEAELGMTLFDRDGARRPALTARGAALLPDARRMVEQADRLAARAAGLREGVESGIALAADVMFPMDRLAGILRAFARAFPMVPLRLRIDALGATVAAVEAREADLAISGPLIGPVEGLERQRIGQVMLVPVAAPEHPLAKGQGRSADHLQLVLTDRSRRSAGQDFGVTSPATWRLGDLSAKHALLREGVGWGTMPEHMVAEDLASGRLVRLTLPETGEVSYPIFLIHPRSAPQGPAGRWLAARIGAAENA